MAQINDPIPKDLVLLENSDEALKKGTEIHRLPWYYVNPSEIYVSDEALKKIIGSHDFLPINDVYPLLRKDSVFRLDEKLKRWNLVHGFYHV